MPAVFWITVRALSARDADVNADADVEIMVCVDRPAPPRLRRKRRSGYDPLRLIGSRPALAELIRSTAGWHNLARSLRQAAAAPLSGDRRCASSMSLKIGQKANRRMTRCSRKYRPAACSLWTDQPAAQPVSIGRGYWRYDRQPVGHREASCSIIARQVLAHLILARALRPSSSIWAPSRRSWKSSDGWQAGARRLPRRRRAIRSGIRFPRS